MSSTKLSRMSRTLVSLFAFIAVAYLLLCAALFVFQRALIYYPQPRTIDTPESLLTLSVADAQVRVTVRPHDGPKALIYFGGNAEDVSRSLPGFSQAFADHAIYLLHYRGYGGSTGSPSEEAIQRDAMTLFDVVYNTHPDIAVIGRSLGSGVAVRLASQRPASRLILITPYNSLEDLAARQFPWFPVKWLLQDKFESWKYAAHITVPTLLVAAEHDEVIPRASTDQLYTHFAKGVASLQVIPDTGHNSISESPNYLKMLGAAL
ncbi:pimeloyl-ACP methyl ester carboxylesterase [Pseudomonas sp. GGS8]|uniref:alpha/beta hydrolase n=1 Tax=Pseudomonas sp. GGS8 TaxID=2817892 RepID=UPI00209E900F|nr:alpha/beta fold hydrolase [Pseudomonas sp. GGS8]MCP1446599.1 pimeloyl-ACP methyl ester carboxylesterase [Pseudomonas sp. GGS8]